MSAPIHSLLADELDLPDAQAEKLLGAMLREVRKRARHRGVRLPELGKFRENNGTLIFEPSESLARAVNHRFEGLDSEDLGSAPDQPDENTDESDGGPSTITLGYQDSSNWSPIDAEDDSTESEEENGEPDTAEFEVPSADDAADTEELQASGDSGQESSSQRSTPSKPSPSARETSSDPVSTSQTETEELYPLVEDMPGESSQETSSSDPEPSARQSDEEEYDRERDTLSGIWGDDDDTDTEDDFSFDQEPESASGSSSLDELDQFTESEETTDDPPATKHLDQDPISEPEDSAVSEPEPTASKEAPPEGSSAEASPSEPSTKEKSTSLRVFATLLILILIGGSVWYILGQRGMAPRPRTTFAQLKAQMQTLPVVGSSDQADASTSPSSSQSSATGSTSGSASNQQSSASSSSDPASEATGSETSSAPPATAAAASGGSSQNIDPAAGGWTIVVASRTNQSSAQTVVNDFRQRFSDQQLPIDVVAGNVENTTRYRVGVGQFESREAAQQFLDEFSSTLPDGAWSLRLQ